MHVFYSKTKNGDICGGPVIKNLPYNAGVVGSIPGRGFKIPHASWTNNQRINQKQGFPGGASDKESACQCTRLKRHGFDSWVGKFSSKRKWQARNNTITYLIKP